VGGRLERVQGPDGCFFTVLYVYPYKIMAGELLLDSGVTVGELKALVKRFCEERDWDQFHNAKDLAIGVVTESSELLDIFRFKSEDEIEAMLKEAPSREKVSAEMADAFYFLLRLAQRYDIDLSEALKNKIVDNGRKYPVEKAKGSNKKYSEM